MAAHQFVGIVKLSARQQIKAHRIDQHTRTASLHHQIIWPRCVIELKLILKPAAPAGQNRHAQRASAHDL